MSPSEPLPILERPKLAQWMWLRGLRAKDGADALDCGVELVRRLCLPFGDPLRRIPSERMMLQIQAWTDGDVGPADFYPAAEPSCPVCGRQPSLVNEPAP